MISKINSKKCEKIKLLITDVDGVLTDGGMYYSEKGEIMKKFHVRDGMGVNLLLKNGIKTAIVTKENSPIVKKWAKNMNVYKVYSDVLQKEKIIDKICHENKVLKSEIAYIGDDVNDEKLLKIVGFSAIPRDGDEKIGNVEYICKKNGGNGVFREITNLILSAKFPKKRNFY